MTMLRRALLTSAALYATNATCANAQQVARSAPPAGTDIVVTAPRRADTARKEEKAAPNIVNIQPAETIAKYPDVNAAEALSRIPGVALSIDTSEGRFVNIRGLDGNLNGATFGGVVLLNTQPGGTYFNTAGRAVEFDTVPIGAIDRIVVTKTGTPDHEAEGLGGAIELTPRTAIGTTRPFAEITLGGGIETFRNHGLYRDEIVIGAPFGGRNADGHAPFSFVATQFLYNDRRGFDDLEGGYVNDQPNTPDKAYDALELRRYNYNRKRFGYSGEFDFTPNDDHRIYVRGSIAGYNESVNRDILAYNGLGDSVTQAGNTFFATGASAEKSHRDEDETHRNVVYQIGGVHHFGDATVDWFGAYSRATYVKHFDYNSTFAGPEGLTVAYDNITDPDHPDIAVQSGASVTDPANYTLAGISNAVENDRDREWSYAGNLSLPLHLLEGDAIKTGFKLRYRRKRAVPLNFTYDYNGSGTPFVGFVGSGPFTDFYGRYDIGNGIDPQKVRSFLAANPSQFDRNLARDLSRNAGGFFDDTENVTAGYVQYQGNVGPIGVLAGVRAEHTHDIYRGIAETSDAHGAVAYAPASQAHNYTDFFPTVQLRYQAGSDIIARATFSAGIARPGFYQTIQSSSVDVGNRTVSTGNPNLKPTLGNNFDLALEYTPSSTAFVSIGIFDKQFSNYVVTRTTRASYPGVPGIATIDTFSNVSGAYARGVEAAASYKFTSLPGILRGFGIDANGSYVDSSAQVRDGEKIALPGTFAYSANAALFYEVGRLKLRAAGQYESKVLFGVGDDRATDVFQDKRLTLDFNGSYDVARNVSVFVNAKNLTNEPLRFYEGSRNRPIQREYYDLTFEGGIKIRL